MEEKSECVLCYHKRDTWTEAMTVDGQEKWQIGNGKLGKVLLCFVQERRVGIQD